MAGAQRVADPALIERLARDGRRFEFFAAVALLERLLAPDAAVGAAASAEGECIAFRHDPRLIFHPSDVDSIVFEPGEGGRTRAVVTTTFLGLTGAVSPLPVHMSEAVLEADASDEPSLRAFYDIFHHALLSLFYRAWAKYRLQERADAEGGDVATRRVLALLGFDVAAGGAVEGVSPARFLGLAPLLALRSRSARSLTIALEQLLPGIRVAVESFVERRVPLEPAQRTALGVSNTTLGADLTIGRAVVDRNGRFRVRLGPLDREGFDALAPGGERHALLAAAVLTFSGGVLEAEIELVLAGDAVPRLRLADPRGARLGVNSRLAAAEDSGLQARFVLNAGREGVTERLGARGGGA